MRNKQVRAMLSSVNPYIGYVIELQARAKTVQVAAVPTKDLPGYLEQKWAVLTMQEYFILAKGGRNDINFLPYFKENKMILLLETKSLPKRPTPFDVTAFSRAQIEASLASWKPYLESGLRHRLITSKPIKIRNSGLKGKRFKNVDNDLFMYKPLSRYTEADVFIGIQNTFSTGESELNLNRGKSRGSDPVWLGGKHRPFLNITPEFLEKHFIEKKEETTSDSLDDFNPASDENYALRAD